MQASCGSLRCRRNTETDACHEQPKRGHDSRNKPLEPLTQPPSVPADPGILTPRAPFLLPALRTANKTARDCPESPGLWRRWVVALGVIRTANKSASAAQAFARLWATWAVVLGVLRPRIDASPPRSPLAFCNRIKVKTPDPFIRYESTSCDFTGKMAFVQPSALSRFLAFRHWLPPRKVPVMRPTVRTSAKTRSTC